MDHYLYNDNLSVKLNIVYHSSLNSKIKINNDPTANLLTEYSEIQKFFESNNLTKVLYFNMRTTHQILYDNDAIIQINNAMYNDLAYNFYLDLLIKSDEDIINYEIPLNYIINFNKLKNNSKNSYFNLINAKISIDFLNNFKNCDLYDEDRDRETVLNLENENYKYIKDNLNILKEINLDLNENDIVDKNIDELYLDIIKSLITNNKLEDYDFFNNIVTQLDLENIDIPFMESENLFNDILAILDLKNEYIQNYIIKNFDDFNDIKKINFFFFLLNYIFKSPFYIYQIPLLSQAHQKIVEIIRANENFNISINNQMIVERIEFVIRKLCNSDYYFYKFFSRKKNANKYINIKSVLLQHSSAIFDISIVIDKKPVINKIEFIYEDNKNINFVEMEKLLDTDYNFETNKELNINYIVFMNCLYTFKDMIGNQISAFLFDYNFKILMEFHNTNEKDNGVYVINVKYKISEHPFFKLDMESSDENILGKKSYEFEGFKSFMKKLNFTFKDNRDLTSTKAYTFFKSINENQLNNENNNTKIIKFMNLNNSKISNENLSVIDLEESESRIIKFERLIYKHEESVKFFLNLNNNYYLSCGNDKLMILYNMNLEKILIINNIEGILHHVSEKKTDNDEFIELMTCYGKNLYLISINKTNLKYEIKNYEIPRMKTLFCLEMLNYYIIAGVSSVMKVEDLFNDRIEIKKMYKIIMESFKTGLPINNDYIALISNELIPNGSNKLIICNLNNNKINFTISDYSFNLNGNCLSLLKLKNGKHILLCACKKYTQKQKNGFLVIELNLTHIEKSEYKFHYTGNLEVFCFCQIFEDTNFFLAGVFDLEKRISIIQLYKIKSDDKIEIKYLHDLEISEEDKNFEGLFMPINNIIQKKDDGNIIITTIDGGIYLFSKPNLDHYLKE